MSDQKQAVRTPARRRSLSALAAGIVTVGLALSASATAVADIAIIVNASNPRNSLDTDVVKRLFTGRRTKDVGVRLVPVDLPQRSTTRAAFVEHVLGTSERRLKRTWARQIFAGKSKPPRVLTNERAVIKFVGDTAGGIGYIDTALVPAAAASGVKVVATVPTP